MKTEITTINYLMGEIKDLEPWRFFPFNYRNIISPPE